MLSSGFIEDQISEKKKRSESHVCRLPAVLWKVTPHCFRETFLDWTLNKHVFENMVTKVDYVTWSFI